MNGEKIRQNYKDLKVLKEEEREREKALRFRAIRFCNRSALFSDLLRPHIKEPNVVRFERFSCAISLSFLAENWLEKKGGSERLVIKDRGWFKDY